MSAQEQTRFRDDGRKLVSLADEFLVACPGCGSCCKVMIKSGEMNALMSPRVVACYECGLVKEWRGKTVTQYDDGRDWYFGMPLWLKVSCCGESLWALNARHLAFLEEYFQADIAEQMPNRNESIISRLPHWMKSAKNKKEVLKGLHQLRQKLGKGR